MTRPATSCNMDLCDSDKDSAFSSEGTRESACTCDSCLCDLSFSSFGSDMSGVNPFGSFKHSGALPYSLFENSSSFGTSPSITRTISVMDTDDNILQDSTHIYINLIDRSRITMAKTTTFWNYHSDDDTTLLSLRPDCEGARDETILGENPSPTPPCDSRATSLNKVTSWLQNCTDVSIPNDSICANDTAHSFNHIDLPSMSSTDSDASSFMMKPLAIQSVTNHSRTRHQLLRHLRKIGRFILKAKLTKK